MGVGPARKMAETRCSAGRRSARHTEAEQHEFVMVIAAFMTELQSCFPDHSHIYCGTALSATPPKLDSAAACTSPKMCGAVLGGARPPLGGGPARFGSPTMSSWRHLRRL
jgi:hypothetical protein